MNFASALSELAELQKFISELPVFHTLFAVLDHGILRRDQRQVQRCRRVCTNTPGLIPKGGFVLPYVAGS